MKTKETAITTTLRRRRPRSAKQLVYFANCCFNSCAEQSHEDSVQKATVEEQPFSKTQTILLWESSSTSLLLISPGLSCESSSTSLLLVSPGLSCEFSSTSLLLVSPGLSWESSSTSLLLISPGLSWESGSTSLLLISPGLSWESSSTSLLLISPGLSWESSSTSLLLISPGPLYYSFDLLPGMGIFTGYSQDLHYQVWVYSFDLLPGSRIHKNCTTVIYTQLAYMKIRLHANFRISSSSAWLCS